MSVFSSHYTSFCTAINSVYCAGTATASTVNDKLFPYNIYAVLKGSNLN